MSQYEHARDWRSDDQYRRYFEQGRVNQWAAVNQLAIEMCLKNPLWEPGTDIMIDEIPDSSFQTEGGSWTYNPDFVYTYPAMVLNLEVKCSQEVPYETIDLKKSQIDALARFDNGAILYSADWKYALFSARSVIQKATVVKSDRFGGKYVYQLPVDAVAWRPWTHRPDFVRYRRPRKS